MFGPSPDDLMVGAMNHTDYAASAVCGACVSLTGPSGSASTIRIVDQCPECPQGAIDLSPQAFDTIADRSLGLVSIRWHYLACDVTGPVSYRFKEGSSQWWTAVQVRHHRYQVAKLEYKKADGSYQEAPRTDYNYFLEAAGMGPGPYTFRITDIHGHAIEDANIGLAEATEAPGTKQFPLCVGR